MTPFLRQEDSVQSQGESFIARASGEAHKYLHSRDIFIHFRGVVNLGHEIELFIRSSIVEKEPWGTRDLDWVERGIGYRSQAARYLSSESLLASLHKALPVNERLVDLRSPSPITTEAHRFDAHDHVYSFHKYIGAKMSCYNTSEIQH